MEEQLVSFETAKLAKEKGFDISCKGRYGLQSTILYSDYGFHINDADDIIHISAPTQSLLQYWIYKNFGYWVDVHRIGSKFRVNIECMNTCNSIWSNDIDYEEPIEALEKGLQEALKLIQDELRNFT